MTDHHIDLKSSPRRKRTRLTQSEQSSAERRRAQQRLAQRAYRIRKDNDIASLRKRINELEQASDETSKAILTLSDKLVESDLLQQYPHITSALHTCLLLSKSNTPEAATESISQKSITYDETKIVISDPADKELLWTEVLKNLSTQRDESSRAPSETTQKPKSLALHSQHPIQETQAPPSTEVPKVLHSHPSTPPIPISFPISAYLSYKPQPRFSQQLVRACFQNGYKLLADPHTNSEYIKQVFGSQFTRTDRERTAGFLQNALSKIQTQILTVVDSRTLKNVSLHRWGISSNLPPDQELLDAFTVENILYERGVPVEDGISTVPHLGSFIFDMQSFIAFLSAVPICTGTETVVFPRHRVETAWNLAMVDDMTAY